jgi:integrase
VMAGRPEHGLQRLAWNWDSRNRYHGRPTQSRTFPTLAEFQSLLKASDLRGQTLIWLAVGCGFGQRDLSELHVQDIDAKSYDLRRSKSGLERYSSTPAQVWVYVDAYIRQHHPAGRMFTTRHGHPLLHGSTDSVHLWWSKLQARAGLKLGGFYMLRGLGATVYGSRPGVGLSAMRTWLGHSASSRMADVYLKPLKPEYRELVDWLGSRLA